MKDKYQTEIKSGKDSSEKKNGTLQNIRLTRKWNEECFKKEKKKLTFVSDEKLT